MNALYQHVRELIYAHKGQFVSIVFIKKDGSERTMVIQPLNRSYILGEDASEKGQKSAATRKKNNPNLINVWDAHKKLPRSIDMDQIITIKTAHTTYKRVGQQFEVVKDPEE